MLTFSVVVMVVIFAARTMMVFTVGTLMVLMVMIATRTVVVVLVLVLMITTRTVVMSVIGTVVVVDMLNTAAHNLHTNLVQIN